MFSGFRVSMVGNGSFLHILKIITDYRNSQLFFVDCCILLKFDNFFVRSVLDAVFCLIYERVFVLRVEVRRSLYR